MNVEESRNIDLEWFLATVNEGTEEGFKQYMRNRKKREEILSSIGFSEILSSAAHSEIFDSFFEETLRHIALKDFKDLKASAEENSLTLYSRNYDFHISFRDGEYALVYKYTYPQSTVREINIVKGTKQEINKGNKRFENGRMVGIDFEQMIIDEYGFVQSINSKGNCIIKRDGKTVSFDGKEYDWDGYPGDINAIETNKSTIIKNIRETVKKYPQTQQAYENLFGKEIVKESLEEER